MFSRLSSRACRIKQRMQVGGRTFWSIARFVYTLSYLIVQDSRYVDQYLHRLSYFQMQFNCCYDSHERNIVATHYANLSPDQCSSDYVWPLHC
jgi:hypothetical protein